MIMEDFSLVLKEVIKKDVEKINIELSESLKEEFDKTAENYLKRGLVSDAMKVFYLTKNTEKLIKIGNECLKRKELDSAFQAFYLAKNREGLDKTGTAFMANGEIKNELASFRFAE